VLFAWLNCRFQVAESVVLRGYRVIGL